MTIIPAARIFATAMEGSIRWKEASAAAMTLIGQGADLGAATLGGVNPLAAAAGAGHADLVRELLDRGARPDDPICPQGARRLP